MNRLNEINIAGEQQTIVALCTPQGSGALALIRLCGCNVFDIIESISKLACGKNVSQVDSHTIQFGFVIDPESSNPENTDSIGYSKIDDVLFFLMRAPRTFTGQDTIEISCHNNPFIIEKIIQLACRYGARMARPGEFSRRAVLNEKLNLVQAEAINDLINAQNELALKKSMEQLHGTLSNFLLGLQADFVKLLGLVEACFEFIEEEQRDIDLNQSIKTHSLQILKKLNEVKVNFSQQKQIREGVKIALLGLVNTGKSTLFNALINQERAIVSQIEGTTRDTIESSIYNNGIFLTFIDTAGLRQTGDAIEIQGIERSLSQAQSADLILLVFDATQNLNLDQKIRYKEIIDLYLEKVIFVVNKIDQSDFEKADAPASELRIFLKDYSNVIAVSAKERSGMSALFQAVKDKIKEIFLMQQSSFLLNQRQARLIAEIELKFDSVVKNQLNSLEYELIAYKLKEILELMFELTGRNINEHVLDSVFNEFCVGK
ncbi:MAG: tRNA uridine-5-carboxymethylaminomethyl(34) synthesis GTPase MnmE [bacterium]